MPPIESDKGHQPEVSSYFSARQSIVLLIILTHPCPSMVQCSPSIHAVPMCMVPLYLTHTVGHDETLVSHRPLVCSFILLPLSTVRCLQFTPPPLPQSSSSQPSQGALSSLPAHNTLYSTHSQPSSPPPTNHRIVPFLFVSVCSILPFQGFPCCLPALTKLPSCLNEKKTQTTTNQTKQKQKQKQKKAQSTITLPQTNHIAMLFARTIASTGFKAAATATARRAHHPPLDLITRTLLTNHHRHSIHTTQNSTNNDSDQHDPISLHDRGIHPSSTTLSLLASKSIRPYFYFIDIHGQVFLQDTTPKNFTSCYKDPKFLNFFMTRIRANTTGYFGDEYPWQSPCAKEINFVEAADTPVVFHGLIDNGDRKSVV